MTKTVLHDPARITVHTLRNHFQWTTQGVWGSCESGVTTQFPEGGQASICECNSFDHGGNLHNADWIAEAHNAFPSMLDEIERLRAENVNLLRDKESLMGYCKQLKASLNVYAPSVTVAD